MHGNVFGDAESGYGKDTFEIPAAHTVHNFAHFANLA